MKKLYTTVNGQIMENELTPAIITALNKIAVARYNMYTTPVYVYDNSGRAYYVSVLWDPARRRVSYGNGKTGYPSINTLAGSCHARYAGSLPAVIRALFPDIKGTCPETCPGCYALPITRNFIPAINTILNTIETETDPARFYDLVEKELYNGPQATCPDTVRIHDSGEFKNPDDIRSCFEFVSRHKETIFYSYSKSRWIATAYIAGTIPNNLHFACSPWITPDGVILCAPVGDMYQFIYDDGTRSALDSLIHCPAVNVYGDRTGVQCKQCGLCKAAKRGGKVRGAVLTLAAVFEYREKSKAARKAARAAKKAVKQAAAN